MKLFKNTLVIIALFTINSACAKSISVAPKKPAPGSMDPYSKAPIEGPTKTPKQSFQSLLQKIRTMPSEEVINDQGVFTETFEKLIKTSGLESDLMEALMQAARNLHIPLSGDNDQDLETIIYAQERIDGLMTQLRPLVLVPSEAQATPNFYNAKNNLLDQTWLEGMVNSLVGRNAPNSEFEKMKTSTTADMINQWRQRNIKDIPSLRKQVVAQIDETVKTLKEAAGTNTIQSMLKFLKDMGNIDRNVIITNLQEAKHSNPEGMKKIIGNLQRAYPKLSEGYSSDQMAQLILRAIVNHFTSTGKQEIGMNIASMENGEKNIEFLQGITRELEFGDTRVLIFEPKK